MREVKALTDYYEKVIYADLISKNIKPDRYGGIRKSVKLHGASGISVRISGYGKTPRECAEKLAFAEIKHNSEAGLQRSEKRFNDVALEWFENSKSHADLAEKNIQTYKCNLNNHILPYFENRTIGSITQADLQRFLNTFEGQGESHVKKIRMTLLQIVKYAIMNGYSNMPALFTLKMPRVTENKRRDKLTESELAKLMKAVPYHKSGTLFLIMLICGLRPSEAIRLQWSDVDLEKGYLRVGKSKTKNGENRVIPIAEIGVDYLRALKAEYIRNSKPLEYVFTQPSNMEKPHNISTLENAFKNLKREADILAGAKMYRNKIVTSTFKRNITAYYLRHTFCSFLSFSGTSDYVAKRLMGHSLNDSVTAGVYTHYNDDEILKAAKPYLDYVSLKLDKILEKPEAER